MTGEGLNWDNYTSSDMGISFQIILLMLLLDCVLYCLGAVYVDATRPGTEPVMFTYGTEYSNCSHFIQLLSSV